MSLELVLKSWHLCGSGKTADEGMICCARYRRSHQQQRLEKLRVPAVLLDVHQDHQHVSGVKPASIPSPD